MGNSKADLGHPHFRMTRWRITGSIQASKHRFKEKTLFSFYRLIYEILRREIGRLFFASLLARDANLVDLYLVVA